MVIDFTVTASGSVRASDLYLATVRNHAKLAYGSVGAWLSGAAAAPPALGRRRWPGRQPAAAGRRGAGAETVATRARRADARHRRRQAGVRRRRASRSRRRAAQSRVRTDRRLHDRGQHRDRRVPRAAWILLAAPHRPHARTVAADHDARGGHRYRVAAATRRARPSSSGCAHSRHTIPNASSTSRSASSSCSAAASTSSRRRTSRRRTTSAWPLTTTRMRPRRIGATPISSPSGW